MLKELKERLIVLKDRLEKANEELKEHTDKDKRIVNDEYFSKWDILTDKQIKLERQVEKTEKLVEELEFIYED